MGQSNTASQAKLAVLTCMDTRVSIRTLGLTTGDAHIIRNAGGIVTEDTLRSLLVTHYRLGIAEIMVIDHTDCGLMNSGEQDLRTRIPNRTGTAAVPPAFFYAFKTLLKMSATNCRNSAPIPGFPRVSLSAASSTTSPVDFCAKSRTPAPTPANGFDRCPMFLRSPSPRQRYKLNCSRLLASLYGPPLPNVVYRKCRFSFE